MRKTKQQCRESNKRESLSDALKLPKDITMGASILTAIGEGELWIENYRGIIEYTDQFISLQGKNNRIIVEGKKLCIDYYSNEDMKIIGCISSIRFE